MFREKDSIPENIGFEIGKTGSIPVSVLTIQYRIGNTKMDHTSYVFNVDTRHFFDDFFGDHWQMFSVKETRTVIELQGITIHVPIILEHPVNIFKKHLPHVILIKEFCQKNCTCCYCCSSCCSSCSSSCTWLG
jgi:hypothetical protein